MDLQKLGKDLVVQKKCNPILTNLLKFDKDLTQIWQFKNE